MKNSKILIGLLFISITVNGWLTATIKEKNALIELQKKELNKDDSIKFVWEGMEEEIPKDGDQLINLSTNENIIYLNPVDK